MIQLPKTLRTQFLKLFKKKYSNKIILHFEVKEVKTGEIEKEILKLDKTKTL